MAQGILQRPESLRRLPAEVPLPARRRAGRAPGAAQLGPRPCHRRAGPVTGLRPRARDRRPPRPGALAASRRRQRPDTRVEPADLGGRRGRPAGAGACRCRTCEERLGPPLRDYAEGPRPRRHTLFLEQPMRYVLEDGAFSLELSLRVDRVVRYRPGVAILDFKTVPPHAFEVRADTWQLRTYALAAPELLGVDSARSRSSSSTCAMVARCPSKTPGAAGVGAR